MHKQIFCRQIILSSVLTAVAITVIVAVCVTFFGRYAPPDEHNTFWVSGTVTEVYHAVPKGGVVVSMSNGEKLKLVYPVGIQNLYSEIGYDVDELANLLEGKAVQCRRLEHWPWVVEIYVDDTTIDNTKLTTEQTIVTRMTIVIVGTIMLGLVIWGDVEYLISKYHTYRKAERKQLKKAKRKSR